LADAKAQGPSRSAGSFYMTIRHGLTDLDDDPPIRLLAKVGGSTRELAMAHWRVQYSGTPWWAWRGRPPCHWPRRRQRRPVRARGGPPRCKFRRIGKRDRPNERVAASRNVAHVPRAILSIVQDSTETGDMEPDRALVSSSFVTTWPSRWASRMRISSARPTRCISTFPSTWGRGRARVRVEARTTLSDVTN